MNLNKDNYTSVNLYFQDESRFGMMTHIGDYLSEFSKHRPEEFKIIVIDNAGFHATKNIQIPDNIFLLRIPPYTPELNPCEQIWAYMK